MSGLTDGGLVNSTPTAVNVDAIAQGNSALAYPNTTAIKVDTFSNYPSATNQNTSVLNGSSNYPFLTINGNRGTALLNVSATPTGDAATKIIIESGAIGKARVTLGTNDNSSTTTMLNAPNGYVANVGATAIKCQITTTGVVDTLANVALDLFMWEGISGATYKEYTYYLRQDSTNTSAYQERASSGEWMTLMIRPGDWGGGGLTGNAQGAISLGAVASGADAARTSYVQFSDVYFNVKQKPSFTFGFDNNSDTHYTLAFPYLKKRGVKGQLYCIPRSWGNAGVMTYAQVKEMADAGWGIGFHGNSSGSINDTTNGFWGHTYDEIYNDAAQDINILKGIKSTSSNGWQHGAWPLGKFDSNGRRALKDLGILTMRETGSTNASGFPLAKANQYWIYGNGAFAVYPLPTSVTWQGLKQAIDDTVTRGAHLEIWGHTINSNTNANGDSIYSLLKQAVDYICGLRDSGQCLILTAEERYNKFIVNSAI